MWSAERRVAELGLVIPDYSNPPYGERYGPHKAFHRAGRRLTIGGMTPEDRQGDKVFPGRVGADLTADQGYQAARYTAINVLGLIRHAVGSLDEVLCFERRMCFVVTTPEFTDVNLVGNGAHDLFLDVFGDPAARSAGADIGVMSLSGNNCFEMVVTVETRTATPAEDEDRG